MKSSRQRPIPGSFGALFSKSTADHRDFVFTPAVGVLAHPATRTLGNNLKVQDPETDAKTRPRPRQFARVPCAGANRFRPPHRDPVVQLRISPICSKSNTPASEREVNATSQSPAVKQKADGKRKQPKK